MVNLGKCGSGVIWALTYLAGGRLLSISSWKTRGRGCVACCGFRRKRIGFSYNVPRLSMEAPDLPWLGLFPDSVAGWGWEWLELQEAIESGV